MLAGRASWEAKRTKRKLRRQKEKSGRSRADGRDACKEPNTGLKARKKTKLILAGILA